MKIYNVDGTVLMEVLSIERNGVNLEFRGMVMGAMPVKGRLTPAEARGMFSLLRGFQLWWFLLTFLLRRSP